jgi:hypothetical protein
VHTEETSYFIKHSEVYWSLGLRSRVGWNTLQRSSLGIHCNTHQSLE